jgi:PiT family inorganic phosphate transporter
MATAWLFTLPAAGVVGAAAYALANVIGGTAGAVVVFVILVAVALAIYLRSRKAPVSHDNVNAEWTGSVVPAEPATV